jgi:glycosyltransferase involved in cell wall biosynthesis
MTIQSAHRVAVLIPCLYGGGAERASIRLTEQLSLTFSMHLFALETGQDYRIPPGVSYVCLTHIDGRASPWKKLAGMPRQIFALAMALKRHNIDVLITFTERPSVIGAIAAKIFTRVRLIMSFRNYQSAHLEAERMGFVAKSLRNFGYRHLIRRAETFSDAVTVLSEGARLDLIENFSLHPSRVHTIFNEYDIDLILKESQTPVSETLAEILHGPSIITAGRLSEQKGQRHLIETYALVLKSVPTAKLIILGVGPLEQELKDLTIRFKLPLHDFVNSKAFSAGPGVYFLGFQANPFALISRASVFAFPSLWEGFGNALIEAMACRVAVVSSDCKAGPRELIAPSTYPLKQTMTAERGEYGLLLPSFGAKIPELKHTDILAIWATTLSELLQDELRRGELADAALNGARRFQIGRASRQWAELIQQSH